MSKRDLRLYCADILDSGSAIIEFVNGLSFEQFCNDRKTYSAVIREFEIIGEAVGKLPEALKGRRPAIQPNTKKVAFGVVRQDLPDLLDFWDLFLSGSLS